ncbi:MAG TPA: TetR/AcrR family transcriptional regulator [Pseudonocardia sp.]|jgi:AcrR family transcriptional regulator|nr:TetR/AcrR family transcriptional regulator [Pseudonocardia sp.]
MGLNPTVPNPGRRNPGGPNPSNPGKGATLRQRDRRAVGPATARGEETRAKILREARTVFERDGYLEARVADIAAEAGVSHGSFYSYFDSKEAVFCAVATQAIEELMARLTVGDGPQPTDPVFRIREANRRYIDAYREQAAIFGLVEQAVLINDDIRALRLHAKTTFVTRLVRGIEHMTAEGEIPAMARPDLVAEALALMVDRTCYMWFVLNQRYDYDDMVESLTTLWAAGIGLPVARSASEVADRG